MVLYHKWDVKNDFAYVLHFFSPISDSIGVMCTLSIDNRWSWDDQSHLAPVRKKFNSQDDFLRAYQELGQKCRLSFNFVGSAFFPEAQKAYFLHIFAILSLQT